MARNYCQLCRRLIDSDFGDRHLCHACVDARLDERFACSGEDCEPTALYAAPPAAA